MSLTGRTEHNTSTEIGSRKSRLERPLGLCPKCEKVANRWTRGGEYVYICTAKCGWYGMLESFCDCCDRPMQTTGPIEAYGIETYACSVCRNPEY